MYIYHKDAFNFDESSTFYKEYQTLLNIAPFKFIKSDIPRDIGEISLQANFLKINNKLALSSKIVPLQDTYVEAVLHSLSDDLGALDIIDFREEVENEAFLYGNQSIVVDVIGKAAFCGVNDLTDEDLFLEYCEEFELYPIDFLGNNQYFTHQYIYVTSRCVFICKDFIKDKKCINIILSHFKKYKIEVVFITLEQVEKDILNMVKIKLANEELIVIAQHSLDAMTKQQRKVLQSHYRCKIVELPFFEKENINLRDIIS